MAFAPSPEVHARAEALRRDIIRLTGEPTARERAMDAAAPAMYLLSRAGRALNLMQQPGLLRTEHRTASAEATQHTRHTVRLQGGLFAGPARGLLEDLAENGRRALARVLPDPHSHTAGLETVTTRSTGMPRSLPVLPDAPQAACGAQACAPQPLAVQP